LLPETTHRNNEGRGRGGGRGEGRGGGGSRGGAGEGERKRAFNASEEKGGRVGLEEGGEGATLPDAQGMGQSLFSALVGGEGPGEASFEEGEGASVGVAVDEEEGLYQVAFRSLAL